MQNLLSFFILVFLLKYNWIDDLRETIIVFDFQNK